MAAAKVLREWTHLLSGDGGAAIVQRMQDRLVGGDFLDEDEDSDDDGRNFYEGLTGGQQNYGFFSRPSTTYLAWSLNSQVGFKDLVLSSVTP